MPKSLTPAWFGDSLRLFYAGDHTAVHMTEQEYDEKLKEASRQMGIGLE